MAKCSFTLMNILWKIMSEADLGVFSDMLPYCLGLSITDYLRNYNSLLYFNNLST